MAHPLHLTFRHLRDTTNVGDAACSPFDRFDWSREGLRVTASDLRLPGDDYDIGIFGGGKIMRDLARQPGVRRNRLNIAWGISTVQRNPLSWTYWSARRAMALIGSRDWDGRGGCGGADWVPCASSEHPLFDAPPPPAHDVVVYAHHVKSAAMGLAVPDGVPLRRNDQGSLPDALAFLASGQTVVSNSYHGVFWGLLLGRRVLCLPFSNKFGQYRLPPGFGRADRWQQDLPAARAAPGLRDLCRAATARFRARVDAMVAAELARGSRT